ncbi:MAG: four helix bundle protein [Verrucomicrobiota bacterium]
MEKGKPIETFEDLVVWQQAIELAAAVYEAFKPCRDFALRDQIRRAAISVSSNIAEGYERGSNNEFVQFLYYAKGSWGEVRSQARLAMRVGLLTTAQAGKIIADVKTLSAKLGACIKVRSFRFK